MLLTILTLLVTSTTFSMLIAMNPLTMGISILAMSLLLAMLFASAMSSWLAFLIFLIYVGGMMVMFSYFVSVIPNQTISFNTMTSISMVTFSVLLIMSKSLNITPPILTAQILQLNILYLMKNSPILIMLGLLLLFTMIVVVKITLISKGPLRPFSKYV